MLFRFRYIYTGCISSIIDHYFLHYFEKQEKQWSLQFSKSFRKLADMKLKIKLIKRYITILNIVILSCTRH